MMNRIIFADNPWPNGHAIKELQWSARIDPETGLWFDLHLESDRYYAEDSDSEDSEEEPESDWAAKIVWGNYHSCTLSSTDWGHAGFLAATASAPLDFANLGDRLFMIDSLPPAEYPFDRAFGIYLLGHDGVAAHEIRFTNLAENKYELDWRGKIAMEYVGNHEFAHTFHAQYGHLELPQIKLPDGISESNALALVKQFIVDPSMMILERRNDGLLLVPAQSNAAR